MDVEPEQAEKAASKSSAAADVRLLSQTLLRGSGICSLFVFVVVVGRRIEEVYLGSLPFVRSLVAALSASLGPVFDRREPGSFLLLVENFAPCERYRR